MEQRELPLEALALPMLSERVEVGRNVAGVFIGDVHVRHRCFAVYGGWILDPLDQVLGRIREHARHVGSGGNSGERWADFRASFANSRN